MTGVLGLFFFLSIYGIWWGLPNFESWSNDDDTPLGPLSAAAGCFREFDKYPPVSHIANSIVYAPYIAYLYVSGNLTIGAREYPYGFSDPIHQMTVLIVLSRVLSVVAATLTVFCVQRLARALGLCFVASVAAAALVATSHEVVLFAHTGNVDTLVNLFFVLCLLSAAQAGSDRLRPYVLVGLWAALALATKDSIWGALFGVAGFVVFAVVRASRWNWRSLFCRRLLVSLGTFAAVYVCFGTAFSFDVYWERILHYVGRAGKMATMSAQSTPFDVMWRTILEMEMASSIPHLLVMAAGCLLLWRTNRRALVFLAVPAAAYYATVLAPVKMVHARYTIPLLVCGALAGGALLAACLRRPGLPRVAGALLVVGTLTYGVAKCLASDILMTRDSRYAAERWLVSNLPSDARLEFYGPSHYFPRFQYLGVAARQIPPQEMTREALRRRKPDVIVVSCNALYGRRDSEKPGDEQAAAYIRDLLDGRTNYEIAARLRTRVPFHRNNRSAWDHHSRISPTIIILRRVDGMHARPITLRQVTRADACRRLASVAQSRRRVCDGLRHKRCNPLVSDRLLDEYP